MDNQPVTPEQNLKPPVTSPPYKINPLYIIGGLFIIAVLLTGGIFIGKYLNTSPNIPVKEIIPIPTLYSSQTVTSIPDPTANWKIYRNDAIGFQFKYPSLWLIKDNSDNSNSNVNLEITSEDLKSKLEYRGGDFPVPVYMQGGKIHLIVDINPFYHSVEEFKKAELKNFLKTIQIPFSNEVLYRIKKYYKEYNSSEVEFLMENTPKRNTPISFIITMGYSEKEGGKYNYLFNQILSTFRFLDQTNPEQNCEINYTYENTAVNPVVCQCPPGYEKNVLETTWGPCPKPEMKDCPQTKFKCVKKK